MNIYRYIFIYIYVDTYIFIYIYICILFINCLLIAFLSGGGWVMFKQSDAACESQKEWWPLLFGVTSLLHHSQWEPIGNQ